MRYQIAFRSKGKTDFHWLFYSKRLAQNYLVNALNRIERDELDFQKRIQDENNARAVVASELEKARLEKSLQKEHPGAKLGRVYRLPASFIGSSKFFQERYCDLMSMVRNLGSPTW